jgi:hypothetical protein
VQGPGIVIVEVSVSETRVVDVVVVSVVVIHSKHPSQLTQPHLNVQGNVLVAQKSSQRPGIVHVDSVVLVMVEVDMVVLVELDMVELEIVEVFVIVVGRHSVHPSQEAHVHFADHGFTFAAHQLLQSNVSVAKVVVVSVELVTDVLVSVMLVFDRLLVIVVLLDSDVEVVVRLRVV